MGDEDVPLICDMPPRGILVLTYQKKITAQQRAVIQEQMNSVLDRKGQGPIAIVLEDGMDLKWLQPSLNWPDAEHCAA